MFAILVAWAPRPCSPPRQRLGCEAAQAANAWARRPCHLMLPRIGRRDDFADAGLVEPLEAGVALEILQVRADRALLGELLRLLRGDVAGVQDTLDAFRIDAPPLAF